MNDAQLRTELISALTEEHAHASFTEAVSGVNPELINKKLSDSLHSIWQLAEHIRISQEDILRYMVDPDWKSPVWPDEYWPTNDADEIQLQKTVEKYNADMDELTALIKDPAIDLTSVIPHTTNHTYLREILLIIDHNSYHAAQIIETRKFLNNWKR